MSEEKALALHLADALDGFADQPWTREQCAAELRRLHGIEFALRDCEKTLEGMAKKYMDAHDQRDELLEALEDAADAFEILANGGGVDTHQAAQILRSYIAKAEGKV